MYICMRVCVRILRNNVALPNAYANFRWKKRENPRGNPQPGLTPMFYMIYICISPDDESSWYRLDDKGNK